MADPFESAVETAFPKEPIDPIQSAADDLKEENNSQMRANMAVSSEVNPDEHAKALTLSDETGVPVQTVKRNIKKVNGIATRNKLPLTDIEKSPAVLKFLSDPDNAMVSHDDMKATTDLDQILRSPKLGIERTDATFELSNLGGKAMNGPLSPKEEKRVAELQNFLSQDTKADTFVEKAVLGTFEFGSQIGTVLSRGVKSGIALGGTLAGGTFLAGQAGPQVATPEEIITVPVAFAGGFSTGLVTSTVQDVNALEGGLAFLDFRAIEDENGVPLDPRIAAIAARAVGATNAAIELTGLGILVRSFPGTKKLFNFMTRESVKRVLKNPAVLARLGRLVGRTGTVLAAETTQEVAQEAVNIIAQEVAKATDPDQFQAMTGEEITDRLATTAVESAQGLAIISLIGPGARFASETRQASKAKESAAKLADMIEKAKESKLRNRSQTRFEQLVKGMAENTGDENVFIPADKVNELFQSEEVSPEILDELGVKDQFDQAMSIGGDLVIPVEKIASVMPDNKALDNLLPHMRFEGEGMSLAEADQFLNDEEAVRQEFIDNAQVALEKDRTDRVESDQIEDVIFNQIRETGEAIDVSRKQAQVFAAGIKTAAFNAGISPLELFGDTNLQIKRELPETLKKATVDELDFFIEEARKGGPKQADAFGSTLTDFVRSRGIKDDRGDLAAFEIDKQRKPGQKNILRGDGQSIDDVALAAQEAGFFPEFDLNAGDRIDINQFVDALAEGDKRFSPLEGNAQDQEKLQAIDDLNRVLDERGIDINTASNEEIKAALSDELTSDQLINDAVLSDDKETLFHSAWHGSPHKFDKFSVDHMGTGEGAQAFGWGLYFAESKDVAEFYKDAGVRISPRLRMVLDNNEDNRSKSRVAIQAAIDQDVNGGAEVWVPVLQELNDLPEGNIFRVELAPKDNEYLNWQTNVEDQGEVVGNALKDIRNEFDDGYLEDTLDQQFNLLPDEIGELKGFALYQLVQDGIMNDAVDVEGDILSAAENGEFKKAASLYLNEKGVRGVKYRDAGSRTGDLDNPTNNFVIFDDDFIEVQEMYQSAQEPDNFTIAAKDDITPQDTAQDNLFQPSDPVNSKAFKNWFGDSKVVDENGDPLVVFHGTRSPIDDQFAFDYSRIGQQGRAEGAGFYFTNNRSISEGYISDQGGVIEAYMSLQNPIEFNQPQFDFETTKKIISKMAEIEAERENISIGDGFLSNFGDVNFSGFENVLEEATQLSSNEETALDQISSFVGAGVEIDIVNQATRDITGHDGVISKGFGGLGTDKETIYVAFFPEQIKSINAEKFDANDPRILFQEKEKDLFIAHNLSADNLIHADEFGGLSVPSLAIARTTQGGFDNFGEITLIADRSLIDPKIDTSAKTFNADVYSPRFPNVIHKINEKNMSRAFSKIDSSRQDFGSRLDVSFDANDVRDNGITGFLNSRDVQYEFLKSVGKSPRPIFQKRQKIKAAIKNKYKGMHTHEVAQHDGFQEDARAYFEDQVDKILIATDDNINEKNVRTLRNDNGKLTFDEFFESYLDDEGLISRRHLDTYADIVVRSNRPKEPDIYAMREALDKKLKNKKLRAEFEKWTIENFGNVIEGKRIQNGFTYSGNPKLLPYDLDTAVGLMKKSLRDGEGFNYGVGSIRSTVAKKFNSIKQIQSSRESIISPENFKKIKDDVDNEFIELADELRPFYKFDKGAFGYLDEASSALKEFSTQGVFGLSEYYTSLPDDALQTVRDFMAKLQTMPTEYFETKLQRAVTLDEFSGAVVPKDVDKKVIEVLKRHGISNIKRFETGNRESRVNAVSKFKSLLFQDKGSNKGGISFQDNEVSIRLFESSDLSTLLHEGGHFFLELRRQMIERGIASSEQVEDFNKVGDWFAENAEISMDWVKKHKPDLVAEIKKRGGIDYVRNLGQSVALDRSSDPVDAAIATGYHELFARGFETYLREGKAPSLELRDAFRSIKEWFRRIYKELLRLNAPLSDDIRGIMDRMLATESQIAEVEAINNYEIMSGLSELMTDAENIAYNKSSKEGTEKGNEELMKKAVSEITREKKKWYKDELAKVTQEVEDNVWSRPVYKVLWLLRKGENRVGDTPENLKGVKLSRSALVDFYGEGVLKHIPKSVPPIFRKSGGMHQDVIAEINGFKSGDDMIKALINAPAPKALIKQEADAIMKQRHGDIFNDGTIEQEAQEIVHNEPRAAFMAIEMRKLSQKSGRANTPMKIIKDAAKRIIGDMAVDKVVKPSLFLRAEQRARKQSQQALIDKDFNKAQIEKRNEILNFHLYKEAIKARDEVQKKTKYMTGLLGRKATKKKIDADYLKKIQDILTAFNFGPRLSDAKRTKLEVQALNSFIVDKQKDDNAEFIIPAEIQEADARGVTHFRDMTMNEFRGLRDIIKNIETQGRRKLGYETNKAKKDFDEAKRTLIERALDKNKIRKGAIKQQSQQNPDFFDKVSETFAGIDASLLKAEQVIEWLDGGSDGPWRDLIFDPIAAAQGREDELHLEFTKKIVDLFEGMPKEIKNKLNDRITVDTLGRTFLRSDLIAMALNVGNEGNFEKMLDGAGWNENQVMEALRILSKEEWDFIQGTWDTINELWPEIEAVDKRMTGVAPIKVEPRKFQTQFGEMRGGYYPVVYDPRRSKRDTKAMSENGVHSSGYTRTVTSHGFTKARTGFSGELLLTLEAIPKHIAEVVHDITHREIVLAVDKLLSDPEVRKVINDTMNPQIHSMLVAWNKAIANDMVAQEGNFKYFNGILKSARLNLTAAIMGFKATVNFSQLAGYTMSIDALSGMIGNKRVLAKTTAQFMKNPMKMARFVQEKSVEMKFRLNNNDRDIRENMRKMMDKSGTLDGARAASLHAIGIFDMAVSVPTWMAAYNLNLSETNNEKQAISFADRTVRLSQGAGGIKDLSEFQRGGANKSEFLKMWSMFYGFFNILYSRLRDSGRELRTINDMPKFASRMWYLVVLSPIIAELLAGRGPDDDESEAAWAARKVVSFPFMSVPIVRDVASGIEFSKGRRVNIQGSPLIKGIEQFSNVLSGVDFEKFNRTNYKAMLDSAGLFGVPATSQTYITSTYLWDYYTGEVDDFEISGLLFARPPK